MIPSPYRMSKDEMIVNNANINDYLLDFLLNHYNNYNIPDFAEERVKYYAKIINHMANQYY